MEFYEKRKKEGEKGEKRGKEGGEKEGEEEGKKARNSMKEWEIVNQSSIIMPPKSVLPTPSEQKRLLDKAKEMMRESQEQAADHDSRHVLLSRSLVSTKPFGKKRRRRGKAVWFIEDKYVNQHNVIKIDKGSKDGKVWVKAAKRFSRPLRCSECGRGPYAKLEGQEGHKMQSCLEADREHKALLYFCFEAAYQNSIL